MCIYLQLENMHSNVGNFTQNRFHRQHRRLTFQPAVGFVHRSLESQLSTKYYHKTFNNVEPHQNTTMKSHMILSYLDSSNELSLTDCHASICVKLEEQVSKPEFPFMDVLQ